MTAEQQEALRVIMAAAIQFATARQEQAPAHDLHHATLDGKIAGLLDYCRGLHAENREIHATMAELVELVRALRVALERITPDQGLADLDPPASPRPDLRVVAPTE